MRDRFGFDAAKVAGTSFWARPHIGRRMFFRHVTSAVGGYMLLPGRPMETVGKAAVATVGRAKNVIFILMTGAPSHVDTFDLKEGPWLPARFNPTTLGDGVRFPQGLMPKIADEAGKGTVGFIRSLRAWAGVHGLMQQWVQVGRNPTSPSAKIAPHIGSVVSLELSPARLDAVTLPAFMAINGTPLASNGYLDPQHAPFLLTGGNGLPNTTHPRGTARLDQRYGLLQELDAQMRSTFDIGPGAEEMADWNTRARVLMYNSNVDRIFQFPNDERIRYGNSGFGNACLTARNLLRARMGTRFVQISFGSWDHHSNIYAANANLSLMSTQFDSGLGNLIADLRSDGLLDETLIIAQGEFGRTIGTPNSNAGRDHFLQQSALFAGAGTRGGRAIGKTDTTGSSTVDPGWSRDRDVRDEDIEATIYSALGIDWTTIRRDDPLGRGFEYVPESRNDVYGPINELWS
jgi:hypothetical protein